MGFKSIRNQLSCYILIRITPKSLREELTGNSKSGLLEEVPSCKKISKFYRETFFYKRSSCRSLETRYAYYVIKFGYVGPQLPHGQFLNILITFLIFSSPVILLLPVILVILPVILVILPVILDIIQKL